MSALLLLAIGTHDNLYWISFLGTLVPCLCSAICCCFLPDSKTNSDNQSKENTSGITWKQLFTRKYKKVLICAFLMGMAQQTTGINSVIIYATATFQHTFSDDPDDYYSSIYGSLLISCVNFVSTIIAIPLINKLGRQWLWFGGYIVDAIAMVLFIIHYAAVNTTTLLIVASIIFLVGFELGPGPVFYVLCGELFPEEVRAKCSGIASTMNWIFNIIVVLIFPYFKNIEWAAYTLYLALMLPAVIVLWVYTPETKGKTL